MSCRFEQIVNLTDLATNQKGQVVQHKPNKTLIVCFWASEPLKKETKKMLLSLKRLMQKLNSDSVQLCTISYDFPQLALQQLQMHGLLELASARHYQSYESPPYASVDLKNPYGMLLVDREGLISRPPTMEVHEIEAYLQIEIFDSPSELKTIAQVKETQAQIQQDTWHAQNKNLMTEIMRDINNIEKKKLEVNKEPEPSNEGDKMVEIRNCKAINSVNKQEIKHIPGKVFLLSFWASWSPNCQEPMQRIQKMLLSHKSWQQKVKVFGLNIGQPKSALKDFVSDKGWNSIDHYHVRVQGCTAQTDYQIKEIPIICLVNKLGKIVFKGHPDDIDIEEKIIELLKQEFKADKKILPRQIKPNGPTRDMSFHIDKYNKFSKRFVIKQNLPLPNINRVQSTSINSRQGSVEPRTQSQGRNNINLKAIQIKTQRSEPKVLNSQSKFKGSFNSPNTAKVKSRNQSLQKHNTGDRFQTPRKLGGQQVRETASTQQKMRRNSTLTNSVRMQSVIQEASKSVEKVSNQVDRLAQSQSLQQTLSKMQNSDLEGRKIVATNLQQSQVWTTKVDLKKEKRTSKHQEQQNKLLNMNKNLQKEIKNLRSRLLKSKPQQPEQSQYSQSESKKTVKSKDSQSGDLAQYKSRNLVKNIKAKYLEPRRSISQKKVDQWNNRDKIVASKRPQSVRSNFGRTSRFESTTKEKSSLIGFSGLDMPDNHGNIFTKFQKHATPEPRQMPKLSKFMLSSQFDEPQIDSNNSLEEDETQISVPIDHKYSIGDRIAPIEDITPLKLEGDQMNACENTNLEHKQGEVILLDLWATWCPPCQGPMKHNVEMLQKGKKAWKDKVRLIGLSVDQDINQLKGWIIQSGYQHHVEHYHAANGTCQINSQLGAGGIPHVALLNPQGQIVFKGHPSSIDLEKAIDDLLEKGESELCPLPKKFQLTAKNKVIRKKAETDSKRVNNQISEQNKIDLNFEGKVLDIDQQKCLVNFSTYFKPAHFMTQTERLSDQKKTLLFVFDQCGSNVSEFGKMRFDIKKFGLNVANTGVFTDFYACGFTNCFTSQQRRFEITKESQSKKTEIPFKHELLADQDFGLQVEGQLSPWDREVQNAQDGTNFVYHKNNWHKISDDLPQELSCITEQKISLKLQARTCSVSQSHSVFQMNMYFNQTEFESFKFRQTEQSQHHQKIVFLVLDRSGSMGDSIDELKQIALQSGQFVEESNTFDNFYVIAYDDQIQTHEYKKGKFEKYQAFIQDLNARNGTFFELTFDKIQQVLEEKQINGEVKVLFFTDGCASNPDKAESSLENLKSYLASRKSTLSSQFYTIGFTKSHDASFLAQIRDTGSQPGTYTYIDTEVEGWEQKLSNSMLSSLQQAAVDSFMNFQFCINTNDQILNVAAREHLIEGNLKLQAQIMIDTQSLDQIEVSLLQQGETFRVETSQENIKTPSQALLLRGSIRHIDSQISQNVASRKNDFTPMREELVQLILQATKLGNQNVLKDAQRCLRHMSEASALVQQNAILAQINDFLSRNRQEMEKEIPWTAADDGKFDLPFDLDDGQNVDDMKTEGKSFYKIFGQVKGNKSQAFVINNSGSIGKKIQLNADSLKNVIQSVVGDENLCIKFGYKTHLDFSDSVKRNRMNLDIQRKESQAQLSQMVYPQRNVYSVNDLIDEIKEFSTSMALIQTFPNKKQIKISIMSSSNSQKTESRPNSQISSAMQNLLKKGGQNTKYGFHEHATITIEKTQPTDPVPTYVHLNEVIKEMPANGELKIIVVTDSSTNRCRKTHDSIAQVKDLLKQRKASIKSQVFAISDVKNSFAERVQDMGSEKGQFIYVDGKDWDFQSALQVSLQEATKGDSEGLNLSVRANNREIICPMESTTESIRGLNLIKQSAHVMIDKDSLLDLEIAIKFFGQTFKAQFTTEMMQKPSAELILRSKIRYVDEKIYKTVQRAFTSTEKGDTFVKQLTDLDLLIENISNWASQNESDEINEEVIECSNRHVFAKVLLTNKRTNMASKAYLELKQKLAQARHYIKWTDEDELHGKNIWPFNSCGGCNASRKGNSKRPASKAESRTPVKKEKQVVPGPGDYNLIKKW